MVALNESITVVNKSGKIVSTSKHLVDVFKGARSAYLERKAELKAEKEEDLYRKANKKALESGRRSPRSEKHGSSRRRHSGHDTSRESSHSRRSSTGHRYEDSRHRHSRHQGSRRRDSRDSESRNFSSRSKAERPSARRGYSDSLCDESGDHHRPRSPRRTTTQPTSPSQLRQCHEPDDNFATREREPEELRRRHSDSEAHSISSRSHDSRTVPSATDDEEIDMALAYGELPPALPARPKGEEEELRTKMTTLQRLLEEANCVEYSVRAVIKNLEENPDAMAAVALTLAEISNLAARMAPGALASLKGSFPVAVALLASPEFLIGGGVALGVTVVVFGGYKIIKRIKANRECEKENAPEELEEITSEVDRIDNWRRGISPDDVETMSVATSVDGEYITPKASMQLREQGVLGEKIPKESSSKKEKSDRKAAEKERRKEEKEKTEKEKSDKSEREKREKKERKELEKDKEPSALKALFKRNKEQVVP